MKIKAPHHCSIFEHANLIWVASGAPRDSADICGRTLSSLVERQLPARWRGLCQVAPSAADTRRVIAMSAAKRGLANETCALPAANRRALCKRSPLELDPIPSTRVCAPYSIRASTVSKFGIICTSIVQILIYEYNWPQKKFKFELIFF